MGYEFRMPEFLIVHGAPVNYFEYILDKDGRRARVRATDAPLIFIGHTHIAECYALRPDGTIEHRHFQQAAKFDLEPGCAT